MLKLLTRTGLTGAAATALLAVSLVAAPAAQAATHHNSYPTGSEKIVVGSHKDTVKLTSASKSTFLLVTDPKLYAATKYRLTVTDSKKHVLFSRTVSGQRALATDIEITTHKYKTDKALVAQIKKDLARSNTASVKTYRALYYKFVFEFASTFALPLAVDATEQWIKAHPDATTFDELLDGKSNSSTSGTVTTTLNGTPQAWSWVFSDSRSGLSTSYDSTTGKTTISSGWVNFRFSTSS